jgi:hypothetical protein
MRGFYDERAPQVPVLKVVRYRQPGRDVHEYLADLLGVEYAGVGEQLLYECARGGLSGSVGAIDPNDHELDLSALHHRADRPQEDPVADTGMLPYLWVQRRSRLSLL